MRKRIANNDLIDLIIGERVSVLGFSEGGLTINLDGTIQEITNLNSEANTIFSLNNLNISQIHTLLITNDLDGNLLNITRITIDDP